MHTYTRTRIVIIDHRSRENRFDLFIIYIYTYIEAWFDRSSSRWDGSAHTAQLISLHKRKCLLCRLNGTKNCETPRCVTRRYEAWEREREKKKKKEKKKKYDRTTRVRRLYISDLSLVKKKDNCRIRQ